MDKKTYDQVLDLSKQLLEQNQAAQKTIKGADFDIEPGEVVAIRSVKVDLPDGEYVRVNATEAEARPPFEWLIELSTFDDHFLLFEDGRLVRAIKKDLFPLKPDETEWLIGLLKRAVEKAG